MRLIGTFNNQIQAREFSYFLKRQGIENECEIDTNTDWGSPHYGDVICKIWVQDEDQVDDALKYYEEFLQNPSDSRFTTATAKTPIIASVRPAAPNKIDTQEAATKATLNAAVEPLGRVTLFLIILCTLIYIWGESTSPPLPHTIPTNIPLAPLTEPPIYKALIYDYPKAFELVDKLVLLFGVEKVAHPNELPAQGQQLYEQFLHTPYFRGIYDNFLAWLLTPNTPLIPADTPMFEKISQGEVWRLFSPCLLHGNLFHILFNMIWLFILGKMMEFRIGAWRYILFILVTGIFSNTAQYIMSGANFIGISGVLTAMFGFIWIRQRYAAWEGYPLQRSVINFIAFFIIAMAALQVVSFFTEIFYKVSLSPGIANTAHLSGAVIGAILGRLRFFSWRT